jgi:hypothetical protein
MIDLDLSDATISSLTRLLRDELVEMCEARGIEVGGTKPVLAKALLDWVSPPLVIGCPLTGSATNRIIDLITSYHPAIKR